MKKRLLTLALALVMALSLAACGGGGDSQTGGDSQPAGDTQPAGDSGGSAATGTVYYLNFKPEQDGDWQGAGQALHPGDRRGGKGADRRLRPV